MNKRCIQQEAFSSMRVVSLIIVLSCCVCALISGVPAADVQTVGGDMGTYLVHCNVDGAGVTFDGTFKGFINQGVLAVPVYTTGTPYKTFSVTKEGYQTFTGPVLSVPQAGSTIDLYATLNAIAQQTPGNLNVLTDPVLCDVYINGVLSGTSDVSGVYVKANVVPATYTVEARKSGYGTVSKVVTVAPDSIVKVSFTLTRITTGSIGVTATPTGASIYLDDAYEGISPLTIPSVSAGEHRMTVKAPGYQDMTIMVTVLAGQATPVTVSLTAIPPTNPSPAPTKSPLPVILSIVASAGAVGWYARSGRK